ncbi:MAG: hypothetical protein K1X86_14430 [Ignavibacteria bacterium]|nr:hypothetical protein [Ignavibacteria bacterium]
MIKKSHRILFTVLALVISVGIVVALSFAGSKTKGPLENLFSGAGDVVQKIENNVIYQSREKKRADKLAWFQEYKSNLEVLKNPNKILIGAFDNQAKENFESVINLEDTLKTNFPLIHIYTAWGSKPEEQFPKLQMESIYQLGSIPVVTWEPWLSDFDSKIIPNLKKPELRDKGGMNDVARGLYDSYIKKWAEDAKEINRPFFLRMGHEMNDPYRYPWGPHNNSAREFVSAWKHVHDIFKEVGADNVIWIWSPHPAYGYFEAFYPGSAFVDYVGVGTLNYGTVASWSQWWSFDEIFGNHYKELAAFKKPIMLTEFGSLGVGGSRGKWYSDALVDLPSQYPAVKAILFFHYSDDKTTTQQPLNWYVKYDTASTKAIIESIKSWSDSSRIRRDSLKSNADTLASK